MFTKRKLLSLGGILSLFLLIGGANAQYQVGDKVSDFTLTDLNDQSVSLQQFSGMVIVLNFFATW